MAQYHKVALMRPTPCPPLVVNTLAKVVPRKANFINEFSPSSFGGPSHLPVTNCIFYDFSKYMFDPTG